MKNKNRIVKIVSFTVCLLFLISSVSALRQIPTLSSKTMVETCSGSPFVQTTSLDDNYFIWEDDFENAQKIDNLYSENYVVSNGQVEMTGTYPQWTNPDWTRMKKVTLQSQTDIDDCIIKLIVEYENDMNLDYSDLRFKFNNETYWLSYYIEERNPEPNTPYAIVWVRIASLLPQGESFMYLFYGNPLASDESNYASVFNENSWQKNYAHDHRVTYHMETEGAWDPDISWGDEKFFVTWEEGIPRYLPLGMIFKQQIRACFYDEQGNQLGNRFDITPWNDDPLTEFRNENPASAYGEIGSTKHFFIAYEHFTVPNNELSRDIKGAIVPSNANSIEDVTIFDICTAPGNQADPRVAYDDGNNRFFVIWEDGRDGTNNYNIYGRSYDLYGNPIGSEKQLTNRPHNQIQPWITFDPIHNRYMIVWEEGIDAAQGPFEIWGQLFSVHGNPLGSPQRISPQATSDTDYNFPNVAFNQVTKRFLVTWQEDNIAAGQWFGPIWGKLFDENANTVVDTFEIAIGLFERTTIVPYLSSSFFVAFDNNDEIYGRLISSDGIVDPYYLQLSNSGSDRSDWAHIATSGTKIFVAWEDTRIVYPPPYGSLDLPDIYANVWSFNIPSSSEVSYSFGEEIRSILSAHIVSIPIEPANLQSWHQFNADKLGSVSFDIVNSDNPNTVIISDISSGATIQNIGESSIRLKASFSRINPSSSPVLERWSVSYVGEDSQPPVTTIKDVDGNKGLNDWYISESVILWLHAEDYPKDTGSGVDATYYTLNNGPSQIYNEQTGILLSVSQQSSWMGEWLVNFWSVDRSGNIENKDAESNRRFIKIDADRPYVQIIAPTNEERVNIPFWVSAEATDNVGIDRVEFDMSPFGERDSLPYVVTDPPYEWYCDEDQIGSLFDSFENPYPVGVNVMVRAQAFDESGQTWTHEVWVHIKNWGSSDGFQNTLCYIYAAGEGVVETQGIVIGGITIGMVSWDFSSASTCFSAGLGGYYTSSGAHQGTATLFIGQVSTNVIAGITTSVRVTNS